jgi:hypothetical protein
VGGAATKKARYKIAGSSRQNAKVAPKAVFTKSVKWRRKAAVALQKLAAQRNEYFVASSWLQDLNQAARSRKNGVSYKSGGGILKKKNQNDNPCSLMQTNGIQNKP